MFLVSVLMVVVALGEIKELVVGWRGQTFFRSYVQESFSSFFVVVIHVVSVVLPLPTSRNSKGRRRQEPRPDRVLPTRGDRGDRPLPGPVPPPPPLSF